MTTVASARGEEEEAPLCEGAPNSSAMHRVILSPPGGAVEPARRGREGGPQRPGKACGVGGLNAVWQARGRPVESAAAVPQRVGWGEGICSHGAKCGS